jgi:hypothetical protein
VASVAAFDQRYELGDQAPGRFSLLVHLFGCRGRVFGGYLWMTRRVPEAAAVGLRSGLSTAKRAIEGGCEQVQVLEK